MIIERTGAGIHDFGLTKLEVPVVFVDMAGNHKLGGDLGNPFAQGFAAGIAPARSAISALMWRPVHDENITVVGDTRPDLTALVFAGNIEGPIVKPGLPRSAVNSQVANFATVVFEIAGVSDSRTSLGLGIVLEAKVVIASDDDFMRMRQLT